MRICSKHLQVNSSVINCNSEKNSVQGASAAGGATVAGNLVVLEREFVVVRNFLVDFDVAPRVDNDLLQRFHGDDLCAAVWLKKYQHANTISVRQNYCFW